MITLDQAIGTENFPEPPDTDFDDVKIMFHAQVSAYAQGFNKLRDQLAQIGYAVYHRPGLERKDFALWPPMPMVFDEARRKAKRQRGPDNPVTPKHPVYHHRPDWNRKEAIANMRSKQLSRPIGSKGCGIVLHRGRVTR